MHHSPGHAADLDIVSDWTNLRSLSLAGCNNIKSGALANLCALNGRDSEAPLTQSLQDLDVSGLFITFPRAFDKTIQPFAGLTRLIMRDNKWVARACLVTGSRGITSCSISMVIMLYAHLHRFSHCCLRCFLKLSELFVTYHVALCYMLSAAVGGTCIACRCKSSSASSRACFSCCHSGAPHNHAYNCVHVPRQLADGLATWGSTRC